MTRAVRRAGSARPAGWATACSAAAYRTGYRLAWTAGRRLSPAGCRALAGPAGRIMARHGGRAVAQYRHNLALLLGVEPSRELVEAGLASAARAYLESFALSGWTPARIVGQVQARGEHALRRAVAERGAVVALPHSGNWDLAGAWACLAGMPVTTVAERLTGPVAEQYERFVRLREGLGMTVIADDDPSAVRRLIAAAVPGRVVCLLADRDLHGHGVPVSWGSRRARMPAGPAHVARRSGAGLFGMVARYADRGMIMTIGPEIAVGAGATGTADATQRLADFFHDRLRRVPEDWHVLAPFFVEDEADAGRLPVDGPR